MLSVSLEVLIGGRDGLYVTIRLNERYRKSSSHGDTLGKFILSQQTQDIDTPNWHQDVLQNREEALENGQGNFVDWSEAKR